MTHTHTHIQEPTEEPIKNFSNGTNESRFATTFDDQSSGFGAFDDGFGNSFAQEARNDPFASSASQDPFGDKKGSAVNQHDVSADVASNVFVRTNSCEVQLI